MRRLIRSPILKVAVAFPLLVYVWWRTTPDCEWLRCKYNFFFESPPTLIAVVAAAILLVWAGVQVFRRQLRTESQYHNAEMPTPGDPNDLAPPN